jgi:hypothetical protein
MPTGQQQTAQEVIGSGATWYVVSRDAGGSPIVLAGPFGNQALALKFLQPPL